jgi:hypothetical protein
MAAIELLRVLTDAPLSDLSSCPATQYFRNLCGRINVSDVPELLSTILKSNLGYWIVDYATQVCADKSMTSEDPEEAALLGPEGALDWCSQVTEQLKCAMTSPQQPFHELGMQTSCVIQVVTALQAALPAHRCVMMVALNQPDVTAKQADITSSWPDCAPRPWAS